MRLVIPLLLVVGVAASACATGTRAGSSGRQRNLISMEELEPFQQLTAYDVIRQLRPRWLQSRRAVNVRGSGQVYPKVAVDGMPQGELDQLRTISVHLIREIRFLNSADATTRFGTGYAAGVIEILTRSG